MSERHNRGGYRKRYYPRDRDDYDERRHETPDDKLKTSIIKLGEVDPVEEIPRVEQSIRDHLPRNIPLLSEALLIGVTEQPYKIPFYAALLRLLHNPSEAAVTEESPLGRLVLEDFWKGFQSYVDKVAWRETRLCIHFFAHLTVAKLVSIDSMFSLLRSFTTVLDEFGVSHGRAKRAALCAGEGLLMAGTILQAESPSGVEEIINAINVYVDTTAQQKWLVCPSSRISSQDIPTLNTVELLDVLLSSLTALNESDFKEIENCVPQPYKKYPEIDSATLTPYVLPVVLVPPEIIELDSMSADSGEEAPVKQEEWPEFLSRLFPEDVSPDPNTPHGYVLRTALLDIIDIFEVNRKECARLLLEYPKWNLPGTFKPKPGAPATTDPLPAKDWQLESTVIETVLGAYMILPESSKKSIYYIALITELCKLSPSTVGPAVGKSIRKLYASLSDGLDVESARRFAEWFAVHMSNFGFAWVWKEWVPDLSLPVQHPRRAFMRRAVEFEIRLAYHERIMKTLPESMQAPDAYTIPKQAPGPAYEYEDPSNPHHDAAQAVLNLFRGRAKAEDVVAHLDSLKSSLENAEEGHDSVDSIVRSIVVQSLLHIGSRSFSHFLNAVERYLSLLRNLASGGTSSGSTANSEAKADILTASASFWKHNRQMVGIVFDKLMQYQIVDPTDVVAWTFLNGVTVGQLAELGKPMNLSAFEWDLLRGALDKANGRVTSARRKVTTLKKEDDDARARVKARADENMDLDAEPKDEADDAPKEAPPTDNAALTTALKAFSSLTKEQKTALSKTLEGFVKCLAPSSTDAHANPHARTVITEEAWNNRANWDRDEWNAWETWGWYRQFCRAYAPYLRTYSTTLYTVSFAKFDHAKDPAAELLKLIWNIGTGQET
ncbi:MIF4G like-domain-containing protein [Gymnopilus junonius]|uniref:MIF4G like-domain-containing protein n=1 Tax=Gymnopilus junonius TaxID=109634 RepID=A0A9P5NLF7_GYMJU|nr:MIF4G like-domain-containing protein [Gymnopilus junonius]